MISLTEVDGTTNKIHNHLFSYYIRGINDSGYKNQNPYTCAERVIFIGITHTVESLYEDPELYKLEFSLN